DPNERMQLGQLEDQTFSSGAPPLEAVNTGRIDMARLLLAHGADPNASVFTAGSATAAAYTGGSPRSHEPDQGMIDLLVQHGGWIDAASVGYVRNAELARRMLAGELDPHLECGTFSGQTVAEQILWSGASGRSADIVRMALERIEWPRGDPRWFRSLTEPTGFWHHIPWLYAGNKEFDRATYLQCFRLILERSGPDVIGGFTRTALHEVAAMPDHVTDEEASAFAVALLEAGARTDI